MPSLSTYYPQRFFVRLSGRSLGILNFRVRIPQITLTRFNNIRQERDPRVLSILHVPYMSRMIARLIKLIEQYGSSKSEVLNNFAEPLQTPFSGNGLRQGNWSGVSSRWLGELLKDWTGKNSVRAVQLRSILLPCIGGPYNERLNMSEKMIGFTTRCKTGLLYKLSI